MSEYHNQFEFEVAHQLELDGWTVFNTNRGFPDLFCVRGNEYKFVECKNTTDLMEHQTDVILRMKDAGVKVEIIKSDIAVSLPVITRKRKKINVVPHLKPDTANDLATLISADDCDDRYIIDNIFKLGLKVFRSNRR
jgi:Holliday junction resolvase